MRLREAHLRNIETKHPINIDELLLLFKMRPSNAFTIFDNNTIVCCCGITEMWKGVGEIWMILSEKFDKRITKIKEMISFQKEMLKESIEKMGLRRVQAYINAENKQDVKYIESIGLEKEALLRKYGKNGEDYYIYRILIEGR